MIGSFIPLQAVKFIIYKLAQFLNEMKLRCEVQISERK